MSASSRLPTAYETLGVHPSAPDDLVSAAYWMATSDVQQRRTAGEPVARELHALSTAYELIADPQKRAAYDSAIGFTDIPLTMRRLPRVRRSLRSRLLRRTPPSPAFDCYEVMGLDCATPSDRLPDAFLIMRDHYLRIPDTERKRRLVALLEEAYSVLVNPDLRGRYDRDRFPREGSTATPQSDMAPLAESSSVQTTGEPATDVSGPAGNSPTEASAPQTLGAQAQEEPSKQGSPARPAVTPRTAGPAEAPVVEPESAAEATAAPKEPSLAHRLLTGAGKVGSKAGGLVLGFVQLAWRGTRSAVGGTIGAAARLQASRSEAKQESQTESPEAYKDPAPERTSRRAVDTEKQFLDRLASRVEQDGNAQDADPPI